MHYEEVYEEACFSVIKLLILPGAYLSVIKLLILPEAYFSVIKLLILPLSR